jgi:hypothetical protein
VVVKEAVNKSNHPIQNPLLLVTEPRTHDCVYFNGVYVSKIILFCVGGNNRLRGSEPFFLKLIAADKAKKISAVYGTAKFIIHFQEPSVESQPEPDESNPCIYTIFL